MSFDGTGGQFQVLGWRGFWRLLSRQVVFHPSTMDFGSALLSCECHELVVGKVLVERCCYVSVFFWFPCSIIDLAGSFIFFDFHPYLGKIPMLANIFQLGWNHQPVVLCTSEFMWTFLFEEPRFGVVLAGTCWAQKVTLVSNVSRPLKGEFIRIARSQSWFQTRFFQCDGYIQYPHHVPNYLTGEL